MLIPVRMSTLYSRIKKEDKSAVTFDDKHLK